MAHISQLLMFFCLLFHVSFSQAYSERSLRKFEPRGQHSSIQADKRIAENHPSPIIARYYGEGKKRNPELTEQRKKRFESLSPEEKRRIREARQRFKKMPPEKRQKLKDKWRKLSPEERNNIIKNRGKK